MKLSIYQFQDEGETAGFDIRRNDRHIRVIVLVGKTVR